MKIKSISLKEQDIIEGCRQGKPFCQRALVERYAPMLLTVARRYARDRMAAQDILQEALIKIFRAIGQYQAKGSFEAWMRRIVVTTALQSLEKNWLHRETGDLETADEPLDMPEVYAQLDAEALLGLIARLPDGFRQVFNLHVMEEYPHAEIAVMLGITESTSRSQLVRARRLLQTMIAQLEKVRI